MFAFQNSVRLPVQGLRLQAPRCDPLAIPLRREGFLGQKFAESSANAIRHLKNRSRRRIAEGGPAPVSWSGVNGQGPIM